MKQVFKFDANGKYLEPVIIHPVSFLYYTSDDKEFDIDIDAIEYQKQLNPELKIKVLPIYEIPENCTEKELPQPNYNPVFDKELDDWVETIIQEELDILTGKSLEILKENKIKELNLACEQTILGRFSVELEGGTYEFGYDAESQSRFNGVAALFASDLLIEIPWTCYLDGERQRILLDKETFNKVAVAALSHCNNNIVKFNDLLFMVNNVVSREELEQIVW